MADPEKPMAAPVALASTLLPLPEESLISISEPASQSGLEPTTTTDTKEDAQLPPPKINPIKSYLRLYSLSEPRDYLLISVGTITAILAGAPLPLMGLIFGDLVSEFAIDWSSANDSMRQEFLDTVDVKITQLLGVALCYFLLTFCYSTCWSLVGERLVHRLRVRVFEAYLAVGVETVLETEMGEISNHLTGEIQKIHEGTAEKVGLVIQSFSYFFIAYGIAFSRALTLTAVMFSIVPTFLLAMVIGAGLGQKFALSESTTFSSVATVVTESIADIRVVQSFLAGPYFAAKHDALLSRAEREGVKKGFAGAMTTGMVYFIAYAANSLAFWYGGKMILEGGLQDIGSVFAVIFIVIDSSFVIGIFAPFLMSFAVAASSGTKLLDLIERSSDPKLKHDTGTLTTPIEGHIELKDVVFHYPARPTQSVLKGVDMVFEKGKTTGIVGLSGSGKSTVVSLLQRFYSPTSGTITLDGNSLNDYNLHHLRTSTSIVLQDSILFDATVMENIAYGFSPDQLSSLSQSERDTICIESAKQSGIHNFIQTLKNGYSTHLHGKSGGLSGGQRQRLSLARALVRDPKILLLDEVTSALDSENKQLVNGAVERAKVGRTTVVVTHDLASLRGVDRVYV
ncbi:hypothetical protein HK097_005010, partial [Rhizophlyctis rosea]